MNAEVQSAGATAAAGSSTTLAVGTVVGGRFTIEKVLSTTPAFTSYRCGDSQQAAHALVLVLEVAADAAALASARQASSISHKNLAVGLAAGDHDGRPYLAYEDPAGHTLRQLLERKKATGAGRFKPKGALNILSHVMRALEAAHPGTSHGCIGLDTVLVNQAGRVQVIGLGMGAYLPLMARAGQLPDWPSLSPEVRSGKAPTVASDVYSIGALSYYTLIGADPVKGCTRPSEAVPNLGVGFDQLVGGAMHPSPEKRFATLEQLGASFQAAVSTFRETAERQAAPSGQIPAAAAPASGPRPAAQRPSLAQAIVSAPVDSASESGSFQVSAALQAALADTEENYLINMGNLDYGPFSLQQVVDQIHSGDIRPGHLIIDKNTGNRQPVEENPLLSDLVEQAKLRRDEERRAVAEEQHASQEKRRGFALYAFILAGVVGLGGGAYLLVTTLSADKSDKGAAEVAALEQGDLKVKITPIKRSKRGRSSGKRSGKGSKGAGGVSGGWDDSLNMDMSEGGGSERLDDSQINPVIQRNGGSLGRCLSKTGSRYADIDFIIRGNGRVSHVRVNGQTSGALANCVRGAMKRMSFPPFNGPRTKANFNMSL